LPEAEIIAVPALPPYCACKRLVNAGSMKWNNTHVIRREQTRNADASSMALGWESNMTDRMQYDEKDPRHHTLKLKQMLNDTAAHAREDVSKVSDPKAHALFETTAEVLKGLVKAFDDFEEKREEAWKTASSR
jgi:hypothetical protein